MRIALFFNAVVPGYERNRYGITAYRLWVTPPPLGGVTITVTAEPGEVTRG